MARLSKKLVREIKLASVYDGVLRQHIEPTVIGFFMDCRPDMWNSEQTELFDIATEIESELKRTILKLLGVEE